VFPQVWAKPARELGCQGLRPVVRADAVNKETILKTQFFNNKKPFVGVNKLFIKQQTRGATSMFLNVCGKR
jgi:hypothetical protein